VTDAGDEMKGCYTSKDSNCCCDVWLSVKTSVEGKGSILIYSYEEHNCIRAKVLPHATHVPFTSVFNVDGLLMASEMDYTYSHTQNVLPITCGHKTFK